MSVDGGTSTDAGFVALSKPDMVSICLDDSDGVRERVAQQRCTQTPAAVESTKSGGHTQNGVLDYTTDDGTVNMDLMYAFEGVI